MFLYARKKRTRNKLRMTKDKKGCKREISNCTICTLTPTPFTITNNHEQLLHLRTLKQNKKDGRRFASYGC